MIGDGACAWVVSDGALVAMVVVVCGCGGGDVIEWSSLSTCI